MEAEIAYRCDGCQSVHTDISDANNCCGYSEGWMCTSCNSFYIDKQDAEDCCTTGESE